MKTERIFLWLFLLFLLISISFGYLLMRNVASIGITQIAFVFFAIWSAFIAGLLSGLSECLERKIEK
ncbi:hypothetical protein KAW18_01945 [candidate division WOR-3 bacterium]|nr:hypothetical protein [candidate division WOR-3 bacterium]